MRRPTLTAAIVLACLATSVPARAQDPFHQTVVVTASARPVELGRVTRTMTVITREQIDVLPLKSVADVLRLASSVDVRARGVRGVQTDFALRGANFTQMLMLVDGVRLNDPQSAHHNGDIPVPLDLVERIEVLYGPGSSLHGADAVGGTINIVTRRAADAALVVEGGSYELAAGRGEYGFERGSLTQAFGGSFDRSSGFMYDRDFKTAIVRSRTSVGDRSGVSVSYLWKEFGANNFYGGNAPSREWTNQTLVTGDRRFGDVGGWSIDSQASYRTHGDRFVFNQLNPALSDNRHRTHTVLGSLSGSRGVGGAAVTIGFESGGDWIRSTNLGDHSTARVSGFGEWRQQFGTSMQVDGLLRLDWYDEFGASWNPSLGVGWWATPSVRVRASAAHGFRVPTFTERYYSDPANLAREEVGPETSWAGEGGVDVLMPKGVVLQASFFGRADSDVIDWLRSTTAERWRTYNIRDVDTLGIELGVRKTFASGAFLQGQYTALDVSAPTVTQLSKYVLDYAPHSIAVAAGVPLPWQFRVAPRIEYRRRSRSTGTSDYVLLDAVVGRRFGPMFELLVDGANLLDAEYQEISGVAMPGATVSISLAIGAR
ncbi:MAG TPA: TonB-dependent receptor [Vicinamibacterales bacterium]|nr:TonB-dependent receptor [Vicinamibacterales bacterium]